MSTFTIGKRRVGRGEPAFLIAELSANHNGSLDRALESIRAAAAAGADAVKLQTYRADTITLDSDEPDFQIKSGPWAGRTLYNLYEEAYTPWEWHAQLFEEAKRNGIEIFSTPFDASAVDLLESLGAPAYKIASHELVDDGLLKLVAGTGKPVILSTGMGTPEEITHAVEVLRNAAARDVVVLRCTSSYPAPDDCMNLASIQSLAALTGCAVGLSDHSTGTTAAVVAIAFGACVIEKHFTLARADGGVDSHFSLEPAEFQELVQNVRRAEAMIGTPEIEPNAAETGDRMFRRSLYVVRDVAQGEPLTAHNVRSIRPGKGLSPRHLDAIIGRRAARPLARGTALSWEHVATTEEPAPITNEDCV